MAHSEPFWSDMSAGSLACELANPCSLMQCIWYGVQQTGQYASGVALTNWPVRFRKPVLGMQAADCCMEIVLQLCFNMPG